MLPNESFKKPLWETGGTRNKTQYLPALSVLLALSEPVWCIFDGFQYMYMSRLETDQSL